MLALKDPASALGNLLLAMETIQESVTKTHTVLDLRKALTTKNRLENSSIGHIDFPKITCLEDTSLATQP